MHAIQPDDPVPAAASAKPLTTPREGALLSLGLFGLTALVFWACLRHFFGYDGEMLYRVTESFGLQHSLRVSDPILQIGQPYPPFAPGISLLLLPLFGAGHLLFHDGRLLVGLFAPVVVALTAVLLQRLLMEMGVSARRSLGVSLVYAFGTIAWYASGVLFTEQVLALALTATLLWLLFFERTGERRWLLFTGAVLGLAVLTRGDALLLAVAPVSLYLFYWERKRARAGRDVVRDVLAYGLPIAAAIGLDAGYDLFRFGHLLAPSPALVITRPWLGLYGLLISPGAGLVVYMPVLLLSLLGAGAFYRRWRPEAMLVGGALLVNLCYFSVFWPLDVGAGWGPRGLLTVLPLLVIPLAFLPRAGYVRPLASLLVILSLGIEALGQLVPYGLYYAQLAPRLLPAAQQRCVGCRPWQIMATVNEMLRYDWQVAPLLGQWGFLTEGRVDPTWAMIAVVVPVGLCLVLIGVLQLRALAARIDRTSRQA